MTKTEEFINMLTSEIMRLFPDDAPPALRTMAETTLRGGIKNGVESYGRIVQEAAAKESEGWADLKENEGAYGTGVRDGVKFSAKAIREMPLP